MYQDRVGNEIAAVNRAVDEVQLAINRENFQQVRLCALSLSRVRRTLTSGSHAASQARGTLHSPSHLPHPPLVRHRRLLGRPLLRPHRPLLPLLARRHSLPHLPHPPRTPNHCDSVASIPSLVLSPSPPPCGYPLLIPPTHFSCSLLFTPPRTPASPRYRLTPHKLRTRIGPRSKVRRSREGWVHECLESLEDKLSLRLSHRTRRDVPRQLHRSSSPHLAFHHHLHHLSKCSPLLLAHSSLLLLSRSTPKTLQRDSQ